MVLSKVRIMEKFGFLGKSIFDMNKYTFTGIFSIALGTFFLTQIIKSNKFIILGVVINTFGLFLMAKGTLLSGKKDKNEIIKKFNEFRKEIKIIKGSTTNIESLHKIDEIENEFDEWAEAFVGDFESKKVELAKNEILLKEREIKLTKEWRHIYQYIIETIRGMLVAYNQKSINKIEFNLPEIPNDLFGKEIELFEGFIIFNEKVGWKISLSINKPYDDDDLPDFWIRFYFQNPSKGNITESIKGFESSKVLVLSINPNKKILSFWENNYNIRVGDHKREYSISKNEYKTPIKDLFKTLIEYQIINLDK